MSTTPPTTDIETLGTQYTLGLGAKFLSHADATRHLSSTTFENKLKRKILNGNQRARGAKDDDAEDPWPQKRRQEDEVDEDSKTFAVGKKKVHTDEAVGPGDESANPKMEEAKTAHKNGDFLIANTMNVCVFKHSVFFHHVHYANRNFEFALPVILRSLS
ncbi:hypothetical protein BC937DRAFT_95057 [Endogone sp. FLAS-F59071]|nr:hypothetical protein BC937DRAFT_95057 [Endogone sp. FLAS-F59071]|eukprot:RUS13608.1 hypothetical protein BC937DRAFT_95057 [Endogone sp. FLAS-F59071]